MGEVSNPTKILLVSFLIEMCFLGLSAEAKYGGGTGEPNDPYLIFTAEQMNAIGANSDDWDKHFRLIADIDLSGFDGKDGRPSFNIIGTTLEAGFSGVFDGNNKVISNFTHLSDVYSKGIFRKVHGENAEIKDLVLRNVDVRGKFGRVGALAGQLYDGAKMSRCSIEDGIVSGISGVGGLVGGVGKNTVIDYCHSTCSVSGTENEPSFLGGLIGLNEGMVSNCYSTGSVICTGIEFGGLVGMNRGRISNCYSTSNVIGTASSQGFVGGLVGHHYRNSGIIEHSYSLGIVSADYFVGGLVGYSDGHINNSYSLSSVSGNSEVGGLVGYNVDPSHVGNLGTILNCYSAGSVTGNSSVGGLVGELYSGTVSASFWDIETSGQVSSDGGTGKTTKEMQTESTFTDAGWDFSTPIWQMCAWPCYPKLSWGICPERLTYYVDTDAKGANNGSNWTNAYNHLQNALAAAKYGDEILVAQGTYKPGEISSPHPPPPPPPGIGGSNETETTVTDSNRTDTFKLKNGVIIKGGYAGFGEPDYDARDIEKYKTILNGDLADNDREVKELSELLTDPCRADNSYNVVTGSGAYHYAVLDGFTITGGNANGNPPYDNGGGMYNDDGRPIVTNCTFIGNSTSNFGGGVYNRNNSNPTFINCTFNSNFAAWAGGGMFNESNSGPTVSTCTFSNNSAYDRGGGIYNYIDSSPTVTHSTFIGNSANIGMGGWMFNFESSPAVSNCTFSGNSANFGGGLANIESNPTLTNCILWSNEPNEIFDGVLSLTIVTYCNVNGGCPGKGNIDADPCFADVNNGDYHLQSQAGRWDANSQTWVQDSLTSPCIDVGYWDSDWSGELWPHGERINMGAFGGMPEASMSLWEAGSISDLNIDGRIGSKDMKLLTGKWLNEALLQHEDLNRDGIVNLADFAIFAHIFGLPCRASEPNPTDKATGVNITADLSWRASPYATSHDVYFGTGSQPTFIGNQTSTTFDPGTMAYGTNYYWRIDEVNSSGKTTGKVWSFWTMMSPPP